MKSQLYVVCQKGSVETENVYELKFSIETQNFARFVPISLAIMQLYFCNVIF